MLLEYLTSENEIAAEKNAFKLWTNQSAITTMVRRQTEDNGVNDQ